MASNQSLAPLFPPGYLEEYNGRVPVSVAIVFIVLEVVCVVLRFWARIVGKIAWGADDTLIIIGAILSLSVIGCCLGDVHYGGVGYHSAVFVLSSPSKLIVWAKYILVIPMVYLAAIIFPKLAILVLYLRFFTKRTDRIACWVIGGLMVANCVGCILAGFFICTPLEFLWNRTIPGGHCLDINAWYRWGSLMNIITDVAMLMLPIPVIWKIQISKTVKLGLILIIATGSSGLITSIIRWKVFFTHDLQVDGTWTASRLITLIIVDSGMYLIAACLPTYRPLALSLWRKLSLSSFRFGSGVSEPEQSKSRLGTYESPIPSESYQLNGVTRLGKDGKLLVFPYRSDMP
ncbi:hypothetical protein MMC29_001081 [Sticta canariensis]|nr:hypothetical protein [Sticta canariensis]